jgi:hypothetical protein
VIGRLSLGLVAPSLLMPARDSFEKCTDRQRIFFNIFIVILRDFVLSKGNGNLRWNRALRINLDPPSGGKKQLKGGMGVGVPIFRIFSRRFHG